jgi:hypothetical protein
MRKPGRILVVFVYWTAATLVFRALITTLRAGEP